MWTIASAALQVAGLVLIRFGLRIERAEGVLITNAARITRRHRWAFELGWITVVVGLVAQIVAVLC
jgi:hypothetical protein